MIKYGSQLYTFRKEISTPQDLARVMRFVSSAGGKCVQLSGIRFAYKPEEVRKTADDNGLTIPLTHTPYARIANETERVAEEHCALGASIVGLGMMAPSKLVKRDELMRFTEFCSDVARKLKPYGLKFGYHNHAFEFRKTSDGRRIIDVLKEEAPEIQFIFDTFWCRYAGYDPAKTITELTGRVESIHVKDWKKSLIIPRFRTLGEGQLDFKEILTAAKLAGTENALIEHDNTSDPYMVTEEGLKYLYSLKLDG